MRKIKELILILCVILSSVTYVYGNSSDSINIDQVNFGNKYVFSENTLGSSFFLMSKVEFSNIHKGNLVFFRSAGKIEGKIEGNVYSFFSDISVSEKAEIDGNLYTLSSIVTVDKKSDIKTKPFILFEGLFFDKIDTDTSYIYTDKLPSVVIFIIIGVLREIICLIILGIKKGFFEQGSVVLLNNPLDVIRFGLIGYFSIISLSLVFLMSIVGFGISIIIFVLLIIAILIGQVSLNMTLGDLITSQLNIKPNPYSNSVIGGIIIEIMTFLPIVGIIFNIIFMPILCLGVLSTNIVNALVRKRYSETPYDIQILEESETTSKDIRNIILKDIK